MMYNNYALPLKIITVQLGEETDKPKPIQE